MLQQTLDRWLTQDSEISETYINIKAKIEFGEYDNRSGILITPGETSINSTIQYLSNNNSLIIKYGGKALVIALPENMEEDNWYNIFSNLTHDNTQLRKKPYALRDDFGLIEGSAEAVDGRIFIPTTTYN